MSSTPLLNFSKGEIAPQLYGRIDIGQYSAALKRAVNVIVQPYGGVAARPGFRVIGEVDDFDQPSRLVPFQFSTEQQYALAFGQATARPLAFGGFVLEEDLKITGATATNPVQLTIALHGYAAGDRLYVRGLTGMPELNNRQVKVTRVVDASTVEIDVDGAGYGALIDSTGIVRTTPAPTPAPAPTPTPTPTPTPPPDTGGGGGSGGSLCVTEDAMILMSDGTEKPAGEVRVGDYVRTFHEGTMTPGDYRVSHAEKAWSDDIWNVDGLRATGNHRTRRGGKWVEHHDIGVMEDEGATIVKLTVESAHTYLSNGVLSHNIKFDRGEQQI